MQNKVLLVHPSTQYATRLAEQLHRKGMLSFFVTSIVLGSQEWKYRLLPGFIKGKMGSRVVQQVPSAHLYRIWMQELRFVWDKWRGKKQDEYYFHRRNALFQLAIPTSILSKADVIIGYDTASAVLVNQIDASRQKFILDVSIGHPLQKEKIFNAFKKKIWATGLNVETKSPTLIAEEAKEIEQADAIVVPSEFVRQTYIANGVASSKIYVNPFGVDIRRFLAKPYVLEEFVRQGPVRFLFMGIKAARKGVPFLLHVWEKAGFNQSQAELIIAGPGTIAGKLPAGVIELGVIAANNRQQIFDFADVFVFPSFFEGLALVQLEAMAAGLPVIGTHHSGAADIITEGVDGFVLEPGDEKVLIEKLLYFINNPHLVRQMGWAARKKAEQFTWDAWGERWADIIQTVCNEKSR